MDARSFGPLVLAASACCFCGAASAQCAAATQVQNVAPVATYVVTFQGSSGGGTGTITIAGVTGSQTGNRTGADQAAAFDNTSAGRTPPSGAGFSFASTYSGWNAGVASGATVTYSSATGSACPASFPAPTATGNALSPTVGSCTNVGGSNALTDLLTLSLVCGRPGSGYSGGPASPDRWQEQHRAGGDLFDFKKGPTDPLDPTKKVGTWSISGTGASSRVTHNYGTSYSWTVHNNGTHYSFCTGVGGAEQVRAFITKPVPLATAGCGGSFPP